VPLVADTPISKPAFGTAYGTQSPTALASDGDGYFALWVDWRTVATRFDLFGGRVDANGTLLDPIGIPLTAFDRSTYPARARVVWNGAAYAALWYDYAAGSIVARRIERDGTVLDPAPVLLGERPRFDFDAVSNGATTLIVSEDSMMVLDAELRELRKGSWTGSTPHAATDGQDYLVARASSGRVVAALFDGGGNPITETTSAFRSVSQVVWTGTEYWVIAFGDEYQRVSRNGDLIGSWVKLPVRNPVVVFSGNGSAVVSYATTSGPPRHYVAPVAMDGSIGEGREVALSSVVGANRHGFLLALNGPANEARTRGGIEFVPMSSDHPAMPRREETESAAAQFRLAADRHAPATIVLWEEATGDTSRIMQRPADGAAPPSVLSFSDRNQFSPAIVSNGLQHLAVWSEAGQIKAIRLGSDGSRQDATPLTIGDSLPESHLIDSDERFDNRRVPPAAIADGADFLIAYVGKTNHVELARVTSDGLVLESERIVAPMTRPLDIQSHPVFTRVGDLTLLAWQQGRIYYSCLIECFLPPPSEIRGIRIGSGGQFIGSPFLISDGIDAIRPAAASDGRETAMITWTRNNSLYARRYDRVGMPVDWQPIVIGQSGRVGRSSVAFDGVRYLIAWEGARDNQSIPPRHQVISTAYVTTGGKVEHRSILPARFVGYPVVWQIPNSVMAIAYERLSTDADTYGVSRIHYETEWPRVDGPPRRRAARRTIAP
jgi:hypothetical protein